MLARFNKNPGIEHWKAVKHLFRYLKGSLDYKLVYSPTASSELFLTYTDADHGGNSDCYCYYYFPSLFRFVYNFCYICSGHLIICYCLLIHVYNLESEYSTP